MFVKCSKMVKFTHPDNPKITWDMPPGFIGEVPAWVEKHWYFTACCNDGTITAIKSKSDRDIQNTTDKKVEEQPETGNSTNNFQTDDKQGVENGNEPSKQPNIKKGSGGKK